MAAKTAKRSAVAIPQLDWARVRPAPVVLVSGTEQFLAERAISQLRDILRAEDVSLEVSDIEADAYAPGQLATFASPSLFDEPRLIRVSGVEKCTDAFITETLSYLEAPAPDCYLVLRHGGGVRGKKLLDALRRMVDFVVVDTSGVFDDNALTALDRSDVIVLVGTLDIPSLKALKLATSTMNVLNFPRESWRFVLNRADGKVGLSVDEYEKTLALKADCTLTSSREVLAAVNRGEALVSAYPHHPNSKALVAFSRSIDNALAAPRRRAGDSTSSTRKPSGSRLRLRRS